MDKASLARILFAIAALLKLFGVEIPEETIDITVDAIAAVVLAWTTWRNNYISRKGQKQKEVLKKNMLD